MARLEKKVAVITGAASGIGRSTAIRFAGEGAAIVIADLNREGGESTARECKETGGNAVFQLTDVAREEDIKGAVDRAVKEFDRLDIIYNNAGLGGAVGPLEKTTAENWDRSFTILLRAVFLGINTRHPKCASWAEVRSSPPAQSPDCAARPGYMRTARPRPV